MPLPHTFERIAWHSRRLMHNAKRRIDYTAVYRRYSEHTMTGRAKYIYNLCIVEEHRHIPGCVVECGVWRGGMSAGMADVLGPERAYHLFDSFEGLPPAEDRDGEAAKQWQEQQTDKNAPRYLDNCRAEMKWAEKAMAMSRAKDVHLVKGWFNETLPTFVPPCPIAILRLDGDWYSSTMDCLNTLAKYLAPGGIIIMDDYYQWDGCSRAVHDFLSQEQSVARIIQPYGICVIEGFSPVS